MGVACPHRCPHGGWLFAFLAWQPHVPAIAGRIVLDTGEVENLREDGEALADRPALSACRVQLATSSATTEVVSFVDAA